MWIIMFLPIRLTITGFVHSMALSLPHGAIRYLQVLLHQGAAVIIDNGQAGTSFTGTWAVSGATGAYGTNSLYGWGGATYTWSFTPTTTATYRVSMWWTVAGTRYTAVPVAITHAGGTANMTVNQTANGGMWNVLGTYTLNAGTTYRVTITAVPPTSPPSTSADAVRFERL